MYGLENRFKMQVLLGLKRAHCEMGIQQPRTTSDFGLVVVGLVAEEEDGHEQHELYEVLEDTFAVP